MLGFISWIIKLLYILQELIEQEMEENMAILDTVGYWDN